MGQERARHGLGALTLPRGPPRESGRYLQHAFSTRPGRVDERVVQIEKNCPHPVEHHPAGERVPRQLAAATAAAGACVKRGPRARKTRAEP